MLFTIMAALAQMEHDIMRERIIDSVGKHSDDGKGRGGRHQRVTDSQIRSAIRLVESGDPSAQVGRDLGCRERRSREGLELLPTSRALATRSDHRTPRFIGAIHNVGISDSAFLGVEWEDTDTHRNSLDSSRPVRNVDHAGRRQHSSADPQNSDHTNCLGARTLTDKHSIA